MPLPPAVQLLKQWILELPWESHDEEGKDWELGVGRLGTYLPERDFTCSDGLSPC